MAELLNGKLWVEFTDFGMTAQVYVLVGAEFGAKVGAKAKVSLEKRATLSDADLDEVYTQLYDNIHRRGRVCDESERARRRLADRLVMAWLNHGVKPGRVYTGTRAKILGRHAIGVARPDVTKNHFDFMLKVSTKNGQQEPDRQSGSVCVI